ncbi:hypothetical protein SEUCBS139899_008239 [Sporothrix eucalyptigena]
MQAVWGTDAPDIDETVAPKRQRLFIARQACEICRQKKTRCDGGHPCGLCRAGGLECKYAERKATKNEVSLGMIFNTLQRIEAKIEEGQQAILHKEDEEEEEDKGRKRRKSNGQSVSVQPTSVPVTMLASAPAPPLPSPAVPSPSAMFAARERRFSTHSSPAVDLASPSGSTQSRDTHAASGINALLSAASPSYQHQHHQPRRTRHVPVIQYPIRQLANWPAIRDLLHKSGVRCSSPGINGADSAAYIYDAAAATVLEQRRPPLPFPPLTGGNDNWLAQLNVSMVKDLGDKYFTTFNLGNPILDRRLFSQHSLGVAIGTGFGVNMESCIVLVTMALGVLGKKALREAGITNMTTSPYEQHRGSTAGMDGDADAWDDGLVFFNEARKRIGLLGSDSSLQACQYHLLCGLFYSQLIRPFDWWAHVNRAASCCTSFWACIPKDCDEWTMDMQARLFWITAMFEAVLTQELDFPVSNLLNYEDRVPLPKFVEFPGMASFSFASPALGMSGMVPTPASQEEEQDAFCHYHFLSQIAHRIILTRLCDSLFANRGKALASGQTIEAASQATTMARSDYPPQALEDELLHQLEQWRSQLPGYLQWEDDNAHRYANPSPVIDPSVPTTPANIFVVPWLQARYCIARYHLRRPLLHRALHHPDSMTASDFDKCRDALACAVRWCSIVRPTLEVMDCLYLKYFLCTQLFGMLLLFHTLERSTVPSLRQLVPPTFEAWRLFAFNYLEGCAASSPSVAREYEIVSALRDRPPEETSDNITLAMDVLQPHNTAFNHLDSHDTDRRQTRSSRRGSLHEL